MKRPALYLSIAASELALLAVYFARTGLLVTPAHFFSTFTLRPFHGVFIPMRFIAVWGLSFSGAVIAALWLILAVSAGAAALGAVGLPAQSPLENTVVALGLGLGGLALAVFFLAQLKVCTPTAALALGLLMLAASAARWRRLYLRPPSWRSLADDNRLPLFAASVLALVLLAFHFIGALVPPSGFDEMDYQLSLPKLYQLNGGFVPTPFSHFSFIPKNVNMLFLLGLVSGGPIVAKFLALSIALLACLALYAFAAPRLGERPAAFSALTFFFLPVIGNQFRVAAPDMGIAFFELIGLFLILQWRDDHQIRRLLLAGVFWGLALGSKYSAFPDFAACLLGLCWLCRKDGAKNNLRNLALFAGTAGLVVSPWLIKNWWETGNPVNPLLSTLIKSSNFYFAGQYKSTVDYAHGLGIENYFPIKGPLDVLLLPWRLIVAHNDYNHDMGPLWLLLAPLALLSAGRKTPAWLKSALVFCAAYWFIWLCGSIHMTRYFTTGLALTSLAAGWLISAVPERGGWRWALLIPVLFAWFQQSARMIEIQNDYKKPWGYLSGQSSVGAYLGAILVDSPYDAVEFINETAPKNARVLVFNEFRTFYLDRDFLASTPWDHDYWHEMIRESATPEELLSRLKARGITYFLCNDSYRLHQTGMPLSDEWTAEDLAREKSLLLHVMKQAYRGGQGAWVAVIRDQVHYW